VEQQLSAGLAERQVAQFVDDDEIVAQQVLGQATAAAGGLFLLELVDQIDQVEEAAPGAGADDRGSDANGEMSLSSAGAADEDSVALGVEESAGGEFAQLALVDRGLGEDERIEVFEDWELGPADAIADRPGLTMCAFGGIRLAMRG
jgi:hypothetical protein